MSTIEYLRQLPLSIWLGCILILSIAFAGFMADWQQTKKERR